jgi:hypothetical protein
LLELVLDARPAAMMITVDANSSSAIALAGGRQHRQRAAPSMNGHRSTARIDKRTPERLERWMLLVSSATMMPTARYPEGQYQCLRNHIRSTAFRTRD